MGPIDIFRLRDGASLDLPAARELGLWGDFPLSTAFIRELAVVAMETGCRGRELRSGGDSFGEGEATKAWSRVLLVAEALGVAPFRPVLGRVGVLDLDVGVAARDDLPLACGRFWVAGELEPLEEALREVGVLFSFRTDTGSFEVAESCVCIEMGGC
jgi:hypothetical protein